MNLSDYLDYLTPERVQFAILLVAIVVGLTPTKSDDGIPGRLRNLAEQLGLLKRKDPPEDPPGQSPAAV